MKVNPLYLRIFSDALIPVIGYIWGDWSLFFILLYYLLDLLTAEIFMHIRSAKIVSVRPSQKRKTWLSFGLLSFAVFAGSVFLIVAAQYLLQPKFVLHKELLAFLAYEDLGIAQGYVLIPLLALLGWQNYRMEFLMRGRQFKTTLSESWNRHLRALLLVFAFSGIAFGLFSVYRPAEWLLLLLLVLLTSLYTFFYGKN